MRVTHLIDGVPDNQLAQDLAAFLTDRRARGLSQRTVEYYTLELGFLASYLESRGVTSAERVTPTHVREYLLHLQERRNAGGCHADFRAAAAWLRWLWTEYELEGTCPAEKVQGPRVNTEPLPPVSPETLAAMLAACPSRSFLDLRDKALMMVLADSGLRANEALSLCVIDCNLATGAIRVEHG